MAKEYKLSAERLEELKQELVYLKTVREKEVADLIKEGNAGVQLALLIFRLIVLAVLRQVAEGPGLLEY